MKGMGEEADFLVWSERSAARCPLEKKVRVIYDN